MCDLKQDEFQQLSENVSNDTVVIPGIYYPNKKHTHSYCKFRQNYLRIVSKNGEINIEKPATNYTWVFCSKWFVTMVSARWRWTTLSFVAAFICNWLVFAFVYWMISLTHGDFEQNHLPQHQNQSSWTPCIKNLYGFTSTFLFSIEIHTTVAYGRRAITLECPQTIITMCLQCVVSSIFQCFMVGILFAKLTRPKSRTKTILFSKHAAICLRNGKMCFIFRVGDMRKSRILNIKASLFILRNESDSRDMGDMDQIELKTEMDGCESTFFLWPVSVIHVIDETSPLYGLSAADLLCSEIEILAVFEGIIESTGQPVQARSSFTENDIYWGHRFVPMLSYVNSKGMYDVDFSKLSETEQIETPLCSPYEYECIMSDLEVILEYDTDSL